MEDNKEKEAIDNTLNQLARSLEKYRNNEKNKELLEEVEKIKKRRKIKDNC